MFDLINAMFDQMSQSLMDIFSQLPVMQLWPIIGDQCRDLYADSRVFITLEKG